MMELNFHLFHEFYTQVAESRSNENKKKKKCKGQSKSLETNAKWEHHQDSSVLQMHTYHIV